MKLNIFVFLFIFIYLNLVKCQIALPQSQKDAIDILLPIYNLESILDGDYCNTPNFICETNSLTIISIVLEGDINNKPTFPNQVIDKFINITNFQISNSIFSESFFIEYSTSLNTISLNNCMLSTFPTNIKNVRSLYMDDVVFNGDIITSTLSGLNNFDLTYSSSELISNYKFVGEIGSGISESFFKITVNNIMNFKGLKIFRSIEFILGRYFDQDFDNLDNLSSNLCKLIDIGHFNQPILESVFNISNLPSLEFRNFQFDFSNEIHLNVIGNIKGRSLNFDNCTGLTDSEGLLKINSDGIAYFGFINSNLNKFPESSFYSNLIQLDLSGNLLSGPLPDFKEPETKLEVFSCILKNNKFSGKVPQNYCYHNIDFSNNELSDELPMCYICSLNDPYIRSRVNGNNFNNYISDSTNNFEKCTGLKFTTKAQFNFGSSSSFLGENIGWNTLAYIPPYKVTPNLNLNLEIPNKRMEINSFTSVGYNALKLLNFKANVLFLSQNLNATLEFDIEAPSVLSISSRPYSKEGYNFFILGAGFTFSSQGYNTTITFGEFSSDTISSSGNSILIRVFKPQLAEKIYNITIYNNQSGLVGYYQYKFERTYPYISSITSPSKVGGNVILYGSYGPDPSNSSVLIGEQNCNIISINSSIIQCTIGAGEGVQNVSLTVNGTPWIATNAFRYLEDQLACVKGCYNGGNCEDGICFCKSGFAGISCSNEITSSEVKKNDTLTEIIKNGYSFGFSIRDIKEVDFEGKTVKQHNFTKWDLTDDSTIEKWTYTNTFGNSLISYTIEQIIGVAKNFTFAGEKMTLQPGSLKLTATIDNWEYLGSLNTLQLQIQSTVKLQNEENECESKSMIQTNDDGTSLNYITIQKDNNIFSGRFIDKVESDGRATFSKVSVSEQTDDSITVSLSLPYCKKCIIDPDFSVMISPDNSPNECGQPKSKLKWIIPISVILGLFGLFGIATAFFFLLRNRVYISRKGGIILLRKVGSSKSNDSATPISP